MDPANDETDGYQKHGFNCIGSCCEKFIVSSIFSCWCGSICLQSGISSSGQHPNNFSIAANQDDDWTYKLDANDHHSPDTSE